MTSNNAIDGFDVGFILTRQWRETDAGQDLHFWMSSAKGPVKIIIRDQESVFFVAEENLGEVTRLLRVNATWRHGLRDLHNFYPHKLSYSVLPGLVGLPLLFGS